jgi:ATP-dependent exoDNAse (exonuclease V) beta subunit
MSQQNLFTIYNASAGSGKTYTLVKSYLSIILGAKSPELFKRILAITFTNKAVAEMKSRIIETLTLFSEEKKVNVSSPMFSALCVELFLAPEVLQERAANVLNTIIHNYAAFDVSTIDGFTHRIIRTFAHDLKLPLNFEVELDQEAVLNEAVDSLVHKAGTDAALTKVLVDFAIEKADEDKSWDITYDLNKIAKLLVNEGDLEHIEQLKDKTPKDFNVFKKLLYKNIKAAEASIVKNANTVLSQIENAGLAFKDFSRGTLPNHFKKASALEFNGLYKNKLEENITERKSIYSKTLDAHLASAIDNLLPEIELLYKIIKAEVFHLKFLKAIYKNVTPLSVLNAINRELLLYKAAENKMLISEFNTIIGNEIKNQPTPFIYERIGEKFKHYFIDEFQDTSVKQWENLMPLLNNALSAEKGSALLVGDAKQAIYRWRGGKAEQFITLFKGDTTPFNMVQEIKSLDTNYRSFKAVVTFNNGFFKYISNTVFKEFDYSTLYKNAEQEVNKAQNGYVELSFLNIDKEDDRAEVFCNATLDTINKVVLNGFDFKDITVLVRKKSEGVAIAKHLTENEIPIISSETLLIMNAPEVQFITNILTSLTQPDNGEVKIEILDFLSRYFNIKDKHQFFFENAKVPTVQFFKALERFGVYINPITLSQLPLYDLVETIARAFKLTQTPNAYLQYYMDVVLDFYEKNGSDTGAFLEYLNKKKATLSIISPIGQNAVQIMTIHKSKGLEFPVVIFPFADLDIYREIEPREWVSIPPETYAGFSQVLLDFNSDFENFGAQGLEIFNTHKSEQELDNINLLYVALTRAEQQLYIITKNDEALKEEAKHKKYSGLLSNYLKQLQLWNADQNLYSFGNPERQNLNAQKESKALINFQEQFISNAKEMLNVKIVTKSGMLWDTSQQDAIEKGNLVHSIMSAIITVDDVDTAMEAALKADVITKTNYNSVYDTVLAIVNHPELKQFYSKAYLVYNERDIISPRGVLLRPDRIVINENTKSVIIIDYKTGEESPKHFKQIKDYQNVLVAMGYNVKEKILVYVNEKLTIKRK